MDTQNFRLNGVFNCNAKVYQTRPVIAAKYVPGMETGYMVYFANKADNRRKTMQYEGVKLFQTESEAWDYINANDKQYILENGKLIEIAAGYDEPRPVLHRLLEGAGKRDGMDFGFGSSAFLSDESGQYDIFVLEGNSWIIQEPDGNVRVWYPELEETFFGQEYICEKIYNGNCCDYVRVEV